MFEKASRLKIRFDTPKGMLAAEDLWDLPLTSNTGKANLDDIAKSLHHQIKDDVEMSFVNTIKSPDDVAQTGFEIVKHIIKVRITERDAAATAAANKERKQQIMAIIHQKQNEALSQTSVEDLMKMVEAL